MVDKNAALMIVASIGFFFASTISLTFFNKWFLNFSAVHFKFPFAIGAWHQMWVFIYTITFEKVFLERLAGPIARKNEYFWYLCPVGVMCALDWGSSNFSLTSVPLSLYEMIKSTCPMWALLISIVVGLQKPAPLLITSIVAICAGTYFSVTGDQGAASIFKHNFPIIGASVLMLGSFFSGLKSVVSQFVMQKLVDPDTGKSDVNAVTMLFYLAPSTSMTLAFFSFLKERDELALWWHKSDQTILTQAFIELTGSAVIAFSVTISGFILTRKTSAVTYAVVKIAQRVGIVGLSMVTFGDKVSMFKWAGFGLSLVGIALYNYYEILHKHKKAAAKAVDETPEVVIPSDEGKAPTSTSKLVDKQGKSYGSTQSS